MMIRPPSLGAVAAAASTLLLFASGAPVAQEQQAERPAFEEFVAGIRAEALARGVSQATLDRTLVDLAPETVVVTRDRSQPENVQSLDSYVSQRLSRRTITTARQMAARHRTVLDAVEAKYGVPPSMMVAIWGLESNFGRFTGTYSTIRALVTLAYDNRRPLFRTELFHAIDMVDKGLVSPAAMKGSWAGAMGQPQFMPSSFIRHAVDFDADGDVDIWSSIPDVFGSMANYLKNAGWTTGQRWGREVSISRAALDRIDKQVPMRTGACRAIREMTVPRPLDEWRELGVTLRGGGALPRADFEASLVRGDKRHFLVYKNYEAIVDYNCSNSYALAAALLGDQIR